MDAAPLGHLDLGNAWHEAGLGGFCVSPPPTAAVAGSPSPPERTTTRTPIGPRWQATSCLQPVVPLHRTSYPAPPDTGSSWTGRPGQRSFKTHEGDKRTVQ